MEAELKFERENISGIAVVGSYLIDAARRVGADITDDCGRLGLCDSCAVTVTGGAEHLTAPTKAEREVLTEERLNAGERLSCQAKIATAGEIVIKTHEKKDPRTEKERRRLEFRKEFDALPLEKKVAQLLELEAVTLSETLSYVMNSPYAIGGKIVDILSGFGFQFDREAREARKPGEHRAPEDGAEKADDEDAPGAETPAAETAQADAAKNDGDDDDVIPAAEPAAKDDGAGA